MSEEKKRKIDLILDDSQKQYDDAMRPIYEGKAETSFRKAILNAQGLIFELEKGKVEWYLNIEDFDEIDVDTMDDAECAIKDQKDKLERIKAQYKEWFGVEYK